MNLAMKGFFLVDNINLGYNSLFFSNIHYKRAVLKIRIHGYRPWL